MAAIRLPSLAKVQKFTGRQSCSTKYQQTKAVPARTLFGTVLDNPYTDALMGTEDKYTSQGPTLATSQRSIPAQFLQENVPGRDKLDTARHNLSKQKSAFDEAEKQLKMSQEQALIFNDVHSSGYVWGSGQTARTECSDCNQLDHARRSMPKLQPTENSLSKGALAKNDLKTPLAVQQTSKVYKRSQGNGWKRQLPMTSDFLQQSQQLCKEPPVCLIELPANIRHKFGSHVCDDLFCDKDFVKMSIGQQKPTLTSQSSSDRNSIPSFQVNLDNNYENLGQKLRYDIFPGLSTDHTISQSHTAFNNETHLRRVTYPGIYHHKRDELITWSEQSILRERMKKAWNERFRPTEHSNKS